MTSRQQRMVTMVSMGSTSKEGVVAGVEAGEGVVMAADLTLPT